MVLFYDLLDWRRDFEFLQEFQRELATLDFAPAPPFALLAATLLFDEEEDDASALLPFDTVSQSPPTATIGKAPFETDRYLNSEARQQ